MHIYFQQVDGIFNTIGLNMITEKENINGEEKGSEYWVLRC